MPSTFSSIPAEVMPKEPGIGGKPPVDRRPTGGGGGGGDDDWQNRREGPGELLQRIRFGVFTALAVDMTLFAVLVAIYFAHQSGVHVDPLVHAQPVEWHRALLPKILYLNTIVLLLSSLTMELARRNIFREIDVLEEWLGMGHPALRRTQPWVAATLAMGVVFLLGQREAWRQLASEGITLKQGTSLTSNFFYMISGLHAVHVVIGAVALLLCLTALGWLRRVEFRQIVLDATAWFWHTMNAAWLLLLAALVLGQ